MRTGSKYGKSKRTENLHPSGDSVLALSVGVLHCINLETSLLIASHFPIKTRIITL